MRAACEPERGRGVSRSPTTCTPRSTATYPRGKHLFGKAFRHRLEQSQFWKLAAHPEVFAAAPRVSVLPGPYQITKSSRKDASVDHRSGSRVLALQRPRPQKPINGSVWCVQRRNTLPGGPGDTCTAHSLRFGWKPKTLRACLPRSSPSALRQGGDGRVETGTTEYWTEVRTADQHSNDLSTKRIAPGETNTWFQQDLRHRFSAEYTTKYPKTLRTMSCRSGKPQIWEVLDLDNTRPTGNHGGIFEFGFPDSILRCTPRSAHELSTGAPCANRSTARRRRDRPASPCADGGLGSQRTGQVVYL